MKDMREVVEGRIQSKLQHGYANAQQATQRLFAEGKIARDFIFEVGTDKKGIEKRILFQPTDNKIGSIFKMPDGEMEQFTMHQNAVRQVSERLKIPTAYLMALLIGQAWERDLGYQILNTHNGWTDRNRVLVRAVGSEVRAVLSDQYRRLNNEMILNAHIETVYKCGGKLSDGYMSDTRIMLESLYPSCIEIVTEKNGTIYVAFGTRTVSSDYGAGAVDLRSFILQGICLNGVVRESVLREIHLGAKLPDNLALSERTYQLDSLTTMSAIEDLTRNLYSSEVIRDRMLEIKNATEITVDAGQMLTSMRGLGKLMKGECDEIGKILMRNSVEDGVQGESTLWKLSQGITAYANSENVDYERRMDLQEIAGELFSRKAK